jgi:hypothetical protein
MQYSAAASTTIRCCSLPSISPPDDRDCRLIDRGSGDWRWVGSGVPPQLTRGRLEKKGSEENTLGGWGGGWSGGRAAETAAVASVASTSDGAGGGGGGGISNAHLPGATGRAAWLSYHHITL